MKVLVTGGAGFIGSAVVRYGLDAGHEVVILDDFSTGYRANIPDGVQVIEGDIRQAVVLDAALKGVQAVFHLAAAVGNVRSIEDPLDDAQINVIGTLNLLEAMRRAGIEQIVYSSSAAIFGEPHYLPVDEQHPTNPDSPYGVTKLTAEKHILCYGRLYNWHTTCLRYFNVYGINQRYDAYGNVIPIFATRLLNGEPLKIYGDGEQTRDFVDVEDVARANWLALNRGVSGAYNVGTGQVTTVNDLAVLIQQSTGRTTEVTYMAPRAGEVLHSRASIDCARDNLGYEPQVNLRDGLAHYMIWFEKNHNG
jgi:UDP-glucose 4-epimerase